MEKQILSLQKQKRALWLALALELVGVVGTLALCVVQKAAPSVPSGTAGRFALYYLAGAGLLEIGLIFGIRTYERKMPLLGSGVIWSIALPIYPALFYYFLLLREMEGPWLDNLVFYPCFFLLAVSAILVVSLLAGALKRDQLALRTLSAGKQVPAELLAQDHPLVCLRNQIARLAAALGLVICGAAAHLGVFLFGRFSEEQVYGFGLVYLMGLGFLLTALLIWIWYQDKKAPCLDRGPFWAVLFIAFPPVPLYLLYGGSLMRLDYFDEGLQWFWGFLAEACVAYMVLAPLILSAFLIRAIIQCRTAVRIIKAEETLPPVRASIGGQAGKRRAKRLTVATIALETALALAQLILYLLERGGGIPTGVSFMFGVYYMTFGGMLLFCAVLVSRYYSGAYSIPGKGAYWGIALTMLSVLPLFVSIHRSAGIYLHEHPKQFLGGPFVPCIILMILSPLLVDALLFYGMMQGEKKELLAKE